MARLKIQPDPRHRVGTKIVAKTKSAPRPRSTTKPAFRKVPTIDKSAFRRTPSLDIDAAFRETPSV